MARVWGALAALLAFALALASPGPARADLAELFVYFDLDRQPATGCSVSTSEGVVEGIELRLRAAVDLDASEVAAVAHAPCVDPGTGAFGEEHPAYGAAVPPWSAVAGDGTSGSTLIEAYLPLSAAPFATTVDAFVSLESPAGGDALLTRDGGAASEPISLVLRAAPVPALPPAWLALLAVALPAALALRSRRMARLAVAVLAASPLLVHAALGDGTLRAWSTAEGVATDPRGDAAEGADLLAAFAFVDAARDVLFVRVDALLGPPMCLAWPTVDPGSGYSCSQEPPPDPASGMRFALTFDDGPNLATTPSIVATLRAANVPATFFVQGNRLDTAAADALVREVHEDALFRVANHSYTHPFFTSLTPEQMRAEITTTTDRLRLALADACYFPRFFRFPYASTNCTSMGIVREYGLSTVGVHLDTLDWCFGSGSGFCSPQQIPSMPAQYRSDFVGWVMFRAQQTGGGIVLMHDIWPDTAQHLPAVLAGLRALGATFVALDDAAVFPVINATANPPEPPACCDGVIR